MVYLFAVLLWIWTGSLVESFDTNSMCCEANLQDINVSTWSNKLCLDVVLNKEHLRHVNDKEQKNLLVNSSSLKRIMRLHMFALSVSAFQNGRTRQPRVLDGVSSEALWGWSNTTDRQLHHPRRLHQAAMANKREVVVKQYQASLADAQAWGFLTCNLFLILLVVLGGSSWILETCCNTLPCSKRPSDATSDGNLWAPSLYSGILLTTIRQWHFLKNASASI